MDVNPAEQPDTDAIDAQSEEGIEVELNLNEERLGTVVAALKASGAERVLDLGCGEGKLLQRLLEERQFKRIVGMDVSIRALEIAADRLHLHDMPSKQKERIALFHGSLMYRDRRLGGYDAASVIEVIEHLDEPRLSAFVRVLYEYSRPRTVILTTPNREYNATWESIGKNGFRHKDHRFEWTRAEFGHWAKGVGEQYGYKTRFLSIGPVDQEFGSPTQMCIFTRSN
jgi:3' terminal RNA ribose 2'-O-methyltransferase Hen1